MSGKFDYYDTLAFLVPGILLAYWIPICFPTTVSIIGGANLPPAIDILGFTAIAVILGQFVQAVGSWIEPLLHKTWMGDPAVRALTTGLGPRYLSAAASQRLRRVMVAQVETDTDNKDLFSMAAAISYSDDASRASLFNAQYAYHRGLIVVLIVGLAIVWISRCSGAVGTWPSDTYYAVILGLIGLTAAMWHRTKQRAYYLVREVLYSAEKQLKSSPMHEPSLRKGVSS